MIDLEWYYALQDVMHHGHYTRSRDLLTLELIGETSKIEMDQCILINPFRKLNYKFMAAEAYWILSGSDRVDAIAPYMKAISHFSDDGETFFGAYGPKVVSQLDYVVDQLNSDPFSRRATLTIWRENPPMTKDYPCTIAMTFFIRDDLLHCHVTMRSNDLWLGRPYDVFNFSMIANAVRLKLNGSYELGTLYLTATSMHIYEDKFALVEDVLSASPAKSPKLKAFDNVDHMMSCLDEVRSTGDISCIVSL